MDLRDTLGNFPERPNHPDFWRLSSVVLKLDGRMDAAKSEDEQEAVWADNVARFIDEPSLTYLAMQRSMRVLGVKSQSELRRRADDIIKLTVVYMEGFQIGAETASEAIKGEALSDLDEFGLRLLLSAYERHAQECARKGEPVPSVADFHNSFHTPPE